MPDIKGVDVASFQGLPGQWTKDPGAQGIEWAAVKFTEVSQQFGTYENPDAKADWDWLWEHKKGRIAYLYAHPGVSVRDTIAPFKAMTDKLGLLDGDGIAVDLEVTDGRSPAAVSSWARELLAELAALYGRRPIVYTFLNFVHDGFCEGLENYFLWIASIGTPGLPQVPRPWQDWFAQQWGQSGPIDQDVAHFSTLAAMQSAMGRPQFQAVEAVWVTAGMDSLVNLSHLLQCEISVILARTLMASANHQFQEPLKDYLDFGDLHKVMPKGCTLRYVKHERV